MATTGQWIHGARPRTLGAGVAPVLVGTAAASLETSVKWSYAIGALVVALALQVGVNYANDYSDGVRGTDDDRTGPMRLTASGLATPSEVKTAAIVSFAIAGIIGLRLAISVEPILIVLGAACLVAGWMYTGGKRPYGYAGLGELVVFIFFGLVATAGSNYLQLERVNAEAWLGGIATGLLAAAILLCNNLRDIETDRVAGKRTLSVRFGARWSRRLFFACIFGAFVTVGFLGAMHGRAFIAVFAGLFALGPLRIIQFRDDARSLVRALVMTSRLEVILAVLLAIGLWG